MKMELTRVRVREYIRSEVADWDDEVAGRARFKDFSGQRSDWEPLYLFWRDLILNIATYFGILILRPSQMKKDWFNRGGLSPLCLDHVLLLMHNEGHIVPSEQLVDPTTSSGPFSQILRKLRNLMTSSRGQDDAFIIMSVLKDKAAQVVKLICETQTQTQYWTCSSFVILTMPRFQHLCYLSGGGVAHEDEASVTATATALLSYLSAQGKARYLSLNNGHIIIQGVKVSLSASPVSGISSLDCDVLHLISTIEKLEQQLLVIDQRCERSRKSALASLNSGNKNLALRHMRSLKLANESREKCSTFLNRVEEVLNVIANAESTKKVTEAIQIGARAIKENKISVKEVQHSLQELEESIDLQKQVDNALLESSPLYTSVEDEDIEEEFKKLELEIGKGDFDRPMPKADGETETETLDLAESLCDAFSNLTVVDGPSSSRAPGGDIAAKEKWKIELEAA